MVEVALRGVGAKTPTSPLPARRLHRLPGRRGGFAQTFYKIDQIPYFDIQNSLFDIRYSLFKVPSAIRLAIFLARGVAREIAVILKKDFGKAGKNSSGSANPDCFKRGRSIIHGQLMKASNLNRRQAIPMG
ncbi:MAG: hypothetical protein QNJ58_10350 [Desulfobacterales bacterium]|nr:hypothetical protein [Desulfobacterales bacterium]